MTALVNDHVVEYLLIVTVSVTIVTTSALVASLFFPRHPAIRHCILLVALICSIANPLVALVFVAADTSLIELTFPLPERTSSHAMAAPPVGGPAQTERSIVVPDDRVRTPQSPSQRADEVGTVGDSTAASKWSRRAPSQVLLFIWAVGAACLVFGFLRSLLQLRRLRQSCRPVAEENLRTALQKAAGRLGIERTPAVLASAQVRAPVVIGPFHPVIVLPEKCLAAMSHVSLCDVLVHEMAHVIRGDHLVLLLECAAKSLFWPIPSVHIYSTGR